MAVNLIACLQTTFSKIGGCDVLYAHVESSRHFCAQAASAGASISNTTFPPSSELQNSPVCSVKPAAGFGPGDGGGGTGGPGGGSGGSGVVNWRLSRSCSCATSPLLCGSAAMFSNSMSKETGTGESLWLYSSTPHTVDQSALAESRLKLTHSVYL